MNSVAHNLTAWFHVSGMRGERLKEQLYSVYALPPEVFYQGFGDQLPAPLHIHSE